MCRVTEGYVVDLYSMDFHDRDMLDENTSVLRVPGGWIYNITNEGDSGNTTEAMCFVPFDDEFDYDQKGR